MHSNQTAYDDTHVQRVKPVRALIDTGGLSVAAAKRVLATLDSDETSLAHTFEAAQLHWESGAPSPEQRNPGHAIGS